MAEVEGGGEYTAIYPCVNLFAYPQLVTKGIFIPKLLDPYTYEMELQVNLSAFESNSVGVPFGCRSQ